MNKLKKFLLHSLSISLLFCSLIFCSSCSGILTSNIWVSDSNLIVGSGFVRLRATILNYYEVSSDSLISKSSRSARSINPEMASQNYAFYLYGQKSSDMQKIEIGPSRINQISESTGEFSMDIPKGIWILTLVAVKDEPGIDLSNLTKIKQQALLWGSTVCDYTNDSSPINFILTPDGLSNKGTVNMNLELSDWTVSDHIGVTNDNLENVKIKAGIYRYNKSGSERIIAEENIVFVNDGSSDKVNFAPKDKIDSTKSLEINPGSYEFVVSFYEDVTYTDPDSGEEFTFKIREWTWSDQLNIFPGRETSGTILIPKLISEPPAAPSNFVVTPLELTNTNISADGYLYACRFEWQDNAETETGFEIRLTDIADPSYEEIYSSDVITKRYYYIEESGNLNSITGTGRNGSISLRIPFGRKIKAQIRAINSTGASAWVDYTNAESINRYSVTFHFNGGSNTGTISLGNEIGTVAASELQNQYTFYGPSNDLVLLSISNEDKEKITRTDDSVVKIFASWGLDPISSAEYNSNPFTGERYQNIDLWAQYKTKSVVQEEELLQDRLKSYCKIGNNNSLKDDYFSRANTTLSFNNTDQIKLTLQNQKSLINNGGFEYTKMSISIWDETVTTTLIGGNTGTSSSSGLGLIQGKKITATIDLNPGIIQSRKTYAILIEATTTDNQVITSVLYFKVN